MNRRHAATIGIIAVIVGVGAGLFVYTPPVEESEVPYNYSTPDGAYATTMEFDTDSNFSITYTVKNEPGDGEQIVTSAFPNVSSTVYWHDGQSVTRYEAETERQYQRILDTDADQMVLSRDNESMTAVIAERNADRPVDESSGQLLLTVLSYPGYERTGTTTYAGQEVVVHEPQSGWYDLPAQTGVEQTTVRVENTSGVVYTDPDTGQLYYANVTHDITTAATWGGLLYKKHVTDEQETAHVYVEYRPGDTDVVRPDWANVSE